MLKGEWRKNLYRVKQRADQNLGRAEKTEALTGDLQDLERRVDHIKIGCQNTVKRLQACMQSQAGTEGQKRLKKLPENALALSLVESASQMDPDGIMSAVFKQCGDIEQNLAVALVTYEMEVESKVIEPLQSLLENDIPHISRLRKHLKQTVLDMDSAKSRYNNALRAAPPPSGAVNRTDVIKEEMEEAISKVNHSRDQLSMELYNFISKEAEYSKALLELAQAKADYHKACLDHLTTAIPQMHEQLQQHPAMPVFGCRLEEHLSRTGRQIASVIEDCVRSLLAFGLNEEGIFRIAGGNSKVKKLRAAFDFGQMDMMEYIHDDYKDDMHCVAGCLKQYLRELPEPLMTFDLYYDFIKTANCPLNQRQKAIAEVLERLPEPNYMNLKYLVQFLAKLAERSDVNKMTTSNIAIVMGPNLLWPPGENEQSMLATGVQSSILECLVTNSSFFFEEESDFGRTLPCRAWLTRANAGKRSSMPPCLDSGLSIVHQALVAPLSSSEDMLADCSSDLRSRTRPLCVDVMVSSPPPLKASPSKSVHSDYYNTMFALQSLGGGTGYADYQSRVRTLWDGHLHSPSRLNVANGAREFDFGVQPPPPPPSLANHNTDSQASLSSANGMTTSSMGDNISVHSFTDSVSGSPRKKKKVPTATLR